MLASAALRVWMRTSTPLIGAPPVVVMVPPISEVVLLLSVALVPGRVLLAAITRSCAPAAVADSVKYSVS
ncbi:unannotated protein [freshwater metagenome]|uniref:Unannotated protein n=1 Tax=freshwater metagenome TaxID=449393 RepID=A0A6J6R5U7_9ZZZZ